MRIKISNALLFTMRVLISGIFIFSAMTKVVDIPAFVQTIINYHILPLNLTPAFALMLIGAEICFSVLFLLKRTVPIGGIGLGILVSIFITAIAFSMLRGNKFNCGCFGTSFSEEIGWQLLLRDVLFLLLIMITSIMSSNRRLA